jgi:acyl carrier protein
LRLKTQTFGRGDQGVDKPWDDRFETMMRESLRFLGPDEDLQPELNAAAAGLDSLAAVELLIRIESTYDIEIPEDLLELDSFSTPGALWALVNTVRATGSQANGVDMAPG